MTSLKCLCDGWEHPFAFASHPNLVGVKNGSLWSLSFEVLSYVFLLWLWLLAPRCLMVGALAALTAILTLVHPEVNRLLSGIAYTLPYFAAGIVMYVIYERFGTSRILACLGFGLLCGSPVFGLQYYAFATGGAYLLIFFATRANIGSWVTKRVGDLSYGVYLFGWPVTQLMQQLTGTGTGWALFAYSLLPTLGVAVVSWWLVERPFLKLKVFSARTAPFQTGGATRSPLRPGPGGEPGVRCVNTVACHTAPSSGRPTNQRSRPAPGRPIHPARLGAARAHSDRVRVH